MLRTSRFECCIPCDRGNITVYQLDDIDWRLDIAELATAIGIKEKNLLETLEQVVAKEPQKFGEYLVNVKHLRVDKNGNYSIKSVKLVTLDCAVGVLIGETALGNLLAGELASKALLYSLMATFQTLAKEDKRTCFDDN